MQHFIFILKSAIDDFRRNKIRTFLTSLGILIGVLSVILLIAIGLGLKNYIQKQFESLGTNQIIVVPGKVLQGGSGFRPGGGALGGAKFDEKDVLELRKVSQIAYIAPAFIKTVQLSSLGKTELGDLFASTEDIFTVYNLEIEEGRRFRKTDVDKRSKIVVIGPSIAAKLYKSIPASIGKTISVENQKFKIIGVTKAKGGGGFGGPDLDSFVYLPYKSALSFNPDKSFFAIYMKARSENVIDRAKEDIKEKLDKRYGEGDFSVLERKEIEAVVGSIFGVINTVLVAIGAISLVVGGIGIMNIMYVSVVERTKEIGIRRAVGATKRDILAQFLAESVLLSLIGGVSAIIIAYIIVIIANRFFPVNINAISVFVAFGVSAIIGIIFGIFPARKASNLTPVEAIRYE